MKLIRFAAVLLVLLGFSVSGISQENKGPAQTLTLQQAVESALNNYPALQIQRYAIEQALGQKTTAGLLPNPVLSYYEEDLDLGGQKGGEEIFSAGLPLNFLWNRWPQMNAASAQVEAENISLVNVQRLVKFEVQKAFVECYYAAQSYDAWQKAAAVFKQAATTSKIRLTDGDISGYEQQRIALEQQRYQKAASETPMEFINSRRRLAFLLDPAQSEMQFEPVEVKSDFRNGYAQVTSPLRRYSDLLVQRQIAAFLQKGAPAYTSQELSGRATALEETARRIHKTEAKAEFYYKCVYLNQHRGETFDAEISYAVPPARNVVLMLTDLGLRLFLPLSSIKGLNARQIPPADSPLAVRAFCHNMDPDRGTSIFQINRAIERYERR